MKLSSLLSDGCVLQRDKANKIWGKAEPSSKVFIKLFALDSASKETVVEQLECLSDEKGNFEAFLAPKAKGGPFSVEVSDGKESLLIKDVFFGDVFLLLGQSNMELPVSRTLDLNRDYCKTINNLNIRQFEVPKEFDFIALNDDIFKGEWKKATQENVYQFSALGFYFAELVNKEQDVTVGLLQTGCGGIQIEALLEEGRLLNVGKVLREDAIKRGETPEKNCKCGKNHSCKFCYEDLISKDKSKEYIEETVKAESKQQIDYATKVSLLDRGFNEKYWLKDSLFDEGEEPAYISIPGRWEEPNDSAFLKDLRGVVWVLKKFSVPASLAGKKAMLSMGTIIDADTIWINGVEVGRTEYRYPPRRYEINEGIIKEENTLVVRVRAIQRNGGFVPEMPYFIDFGDEKIDLEGQYEYKIGVDFTALNGGVVENLPDMTFFLYRPCGMYNRMIYPLRNMSLKAFMFYQGESNTMYYKDYDPLMRELVREIRDLFNDNLPLLYVQLPFFGGEDDERGTTIWDDFRKVQAGFSDIENSVMVDAYDLGFRYELHPQTKRELAIRIFNKFKDILY